MAHNVKGLWNLSKGAFSNVLVRSTILNASNGRYMYTDAFLKIPEYEKFRHITRAQYMAVEDIFREKMNTICETGKGKIYMEDLKAMLYIAQHEDIELISKMIEKYNTTEYSNYVFGPVIMRTLYFLDEPKAAYKLFKAEGNTQLFNKISVYTILMNLLYKHAMYQEVVDVWDTLMQHNPEYTTGTQSTRTILFAALAKQGTKEALERAQSLWNKLKKEDKMIRREYSLYINLLLTCKQSEEVLKLLENTKVRSRISNYAKIMALLQLENYTAVYEMLQYILDNTTTEKGQLLFKDLHFSIAQLPDTNEYKSKLQSLLQAFPMFLKSSQNFDTYVFHPISAGNAQNVNPARNNNQRRSFRQNMMSTAF